MMTFFLKLKRWEEVSRIVFKIYIPGAFTGTKPTNSARLTLLFIVLGHTSTNNSLLLDPFFLDDDESEMKMAKKESVVVPEKLDSAASIFKAVERSVTDGKGPSPRKKDNDPIESKSSDWEWDGTVDEDAHMGWD